MKPLSNLHMFQLGSLVTRPQAAGEDPERFHDLVRVGWAARRVDGAGRVLGEVTDAGVAAIARWMDRAAFPESLLGATPLQTRAYNFIVTSIMRDGAPPSRLMIKDHFGLSNVSQAQRLVVGLEKRGLLRRIPGHRRGIVLEPAPRANVVRQPVAEAAR